MAIDFSKFKKDPSAATSALQASLEASKGSKDFGDDDVWKPTVDRDGNGSALLRFIFDPNNKEFVKLNNHGFKKNGRWFIENCKRTFGWEEECMVCEHANLLKQGREWAKIPKAEQDAIKPFFSKTSYWTNVYVIKDPGCPANEGQIFKYRFGKKIYDMIDKALEEDPLDGTPGFSAYDPFNGADFKMIIKDVAGWRNYDDSSFAQPSPWLKGDQDLMEKKVESEAYLLSTIVDDNQFLSNEDMTKKFNTIMGIAIPAPTTEAAQISEPIPEPTPAPEQKASASEAKKGSVDDDYFNELIDGL